jgi:Zn-dependent M28 family amino/carboxypeptidase
VAARIRKELLLAHLHRIAGDRNAFTHPRRLKAVGDYVAEQFRAAGCEVRRDDVRIFLRRYPNIIAEPANNNPDAPLFIVGAHYDSVFGSPGADDNATGVAALLEIARVVKHHRLRLQFVAFNLEEEGMLGSAHYAGILAANKVNLAGMISLEMLGFKSDTPGSQQLPAGYESLYPRTGNFIGVVGNERSRELCETVVAAMKTVEALPVESLVVPGNGEILAPVRLSDHSPFWDLGFRALIITDTSWFRNPHYHQKTDTIETLDLEFLAKVTEAITRAIEALSSKRSAD